MFLAFLAGIALTLAFLSLAPRTFQSQAKLFVRLGRESVSLDPTVTTGQFVGVVDSRESEVLAVEELLTSRSAAERIVNEFGADVVLERDLKNSGPGLGDRLSGLDAYNLNPFRVYSLHDKAVKAFQENLRVSSGAKTSVVTLSYVCEDPKLAQALLKSLLAMASDEHLRIHRDREARRNFSRRRRRHMLKTHLAELEDQFRHLKNKTGVASRSLDATGNPIAADRRFANRTTSGKHGAQRGPGRNRTSSPTPDGCAGPQRQRAEDRPTPLHRPGAATETIRVGNHRRRDGFEVHRVEHTTVAW